MELQIWKKHMSYKIRRGCYTPTRAEVAENLRAGAAWMRQRDLPDVCGWTDFNEAPDLVHERLSSRLRENRCPSLAGTCPLPKPGKGEMRTMAWLDPYDELYLRIIVGRIAAGTESALGSDVYSYRLLNEAPGWSVMEAKEAFARRLIRGKELLGDKRCNALAVADIRHYYPSVSHEVLIGNLEKIITSRAAVQRVSDFFQGLQETSELRGLPVGPEACGLLGNIILLEVDKALADCTLGHVRYTDDSWIYLPSETIWPEIYDIYSMVISTLDLEANNSKVEVYSKSSGDAQDVMEHEQISYLISDAGNYRNSKMAAADIREQLSQETPDWQLIKFLFGSLRCQNNSNGLDILYEHSNVLYELPTDVGRYLSSIAASKRLRSQIDHDWLITQAIDLNPPRSIAGQVQVCRVASQLRMSKEHGKRLEELVFDNRARRYPTLQAWAARAWGSSNAHKPEQAVGNACHCGDFTVKRAFALTINPDASTLHKRSRWCRKLNSADPDLAPTIAPLR